MGSLLGAISIRILSVTGYFLFPFGGEAWLCFCRPVKVVEPDLSGGRGNREVVGIELVEDGDAGFGQGNSGVRLEIGFIYIIYVYMYKYTFLAKTLATSEVSLLGRIPLKCRSTWNPKRGFFRSCMGSLCFMTVERNLSKMTYPFSDNHGSGHVAS